MLKGNGLVTAMVNKLYDLPSEGKEKDNER